MPIEFLDEAAPVVEAASSKFEFLDEAPDPFKDVYKGGDAEVDSYMSSQKEETEKLSQLIFTPEERADLEAKGPINWIESVSPRWTNWSDVVPYVGTGKEAGEDVGIAILAKQMSEGKEISSGNRQKVMDYMRSETEKSIRGFSWGGEVAYTAVRMPAWMVEIGTSFGIGKAAGTAVKAAAKAGAKKSIIATAAGATTAGAVTTAVMPQRYIGSYGERRIAEHLGITDKGELLLRDAEESPWTTALKAYLDTGVEVVSEQAGGPISKYAVAPVKKSLMPVVTNAYNKLPPKVRTALFQAYKEIQPNATVKNFLSKTGFHGALAEMGEERVADIMRVALDLDPEKGYSVDQALGALYPGKDQLLVEAGVFAVMGGTARATSYLMNTLEAKGYTKAESKKITEDLTATERDALFEKLTKDQLRTSLDTVEASARDMAKKAQVPEEEADAWAKVIRGNSLWGAKQYNITPQKYFESLNLDVRTDKATPLPTKDLRKILRQEPDQSGVFPKFYKEAKAYLDTAAMSARKKTGQTLSNFVRSKGGVYDDGGDLKSRDIKGDIARMSPRQARLQGIPQGKLKGMGMDKMRELAFEAGYFPGKAHYDEITDSEFIDMLEADYHGAAKSYPFNEKNLAIDDAQNALDQYESIGIDPNMSEADIAAAMQEYFIANDMDLNSTPEMDADALARMNVPVDELNQPVNKDVDLNRKVDVVDLSHLAGKEITKESLREQLYSLAKSRPLMPTADQNRLIRFLPKNVRHVMWSGAPTRKDVRPVRKKALAGIHDLIMNSVLVESVPDQKSQSGARTFHRFYVPVKVGDKFFTVRLVARQTKDGLRLDPEAFDLYDVVIDGKMAPPAVELESTSRGERPSSSVSIRQMLSNVNDAEGNQYFQANRGSIRFEDMKTIITLFETADTSTLFHETGHLFLRQLRTAAASSAEAKAQYEGVLKWLGSDGVFTREQEETFARGFEAFLMEGSAPSQTLRDTFESFKEWFLELYQTIRGLNVTINNEMRDVLDAMLGGKDLDIYSPVIKIENAESGWAKFYRYVVDDLQPIEGLVRNFEKIKGKLPEGTNPNFLARLYASTRGRIVENIQNQTYYIDEFGNNVITGEGFKPILDDFDAEFQKIEPSYQKRVKDFKDYLIARRYEQDLKDREDVEVSARQEEESAATMARLSFKYGSEFIRFDDYAKRVYAFEKRILYNLVQSGVMSKESYDKIIDANPNYVPFQRVFSEEEIEDGFVITPKGKFEGSSSLSIVQKITGSDRAVNDVFENIVRSTARTLQAAQRNRIAASVANLRHALPGNVQKVKAPMRPIELEDGKTVYRPAGKPFGNVIEYYVGGKRQFVEVSKPLYEAMQGMHPSEITFFEKLFSGIAGIFRAAATLPPDFWIRNFVRDVNQAFVQTEKGIKPIDIVQAMTAVIGKTELYHDWMRSGGSFNSYMDISDKGIEKAMQELIRPQGKAMLYAKSFGIRALQDASGAVEQTTRIAIYKRALKSGLGQSRAVLESRDGTLDFSRAGKVGRIWNRYIPFLNAGIQGTDKLLRAFKKNPEVMTFRAIMTITVPSIVLTGYYLYGAPEDERNEFLEMPQWQKDMFWVFKAGGSWWRIPKPFSLGYAFGSLPERFMLWSYDGDKPEAENMWREFVLGLGGSLSPIQDIGTLMTPVGRIVVESASNYNFFTGRNIYPAWMDRLPVEERSQKFTSETAKELGEALGYSPALIDNAIRNSLATTTPYAMAASDGIVNAVKKWNGEEIPEKPVTNSDTLFVRGFSVRSPEGYRSRSAENFFDKWGRVQQVHAAFNQKKGAEKQEYFEANKREISAYRGMFKFNKRLGSIGDKIDRIYEDKDMSSEEKVEEISALEKQITAAAKEANSWFNARD